MTCKQQVKGESKNKVMSNKPSAYRNWKYLSRQHTQPDAMPTQDFRPFPTFSIAQNNRLRIFCRLIKKEKPNNIEIFPPIRAWCEDRRLSLDWILIPNAMLEIRHCSSPPKQVEVWFKSCFGECFSATGTGRHRTSRRDLKMVVHSLSQSHLTQLGNKRKYPQI